jgi:hypothetical protein
MTRPEGWSGLEVMKSGVGGFAKRRWAGYQKVTNAEIGRRRSSDVRCKCVCLQDAQWRNILCEVAGSRSKAERQDGM